MLCFSAGSGFSCALIRLDALALSVIATAMWLGGWVAGCHTPVLYQNGETYQKTFSTT